MAEGSGGRGLTDNEVKNAIDVWKKIVDVQQHFNDLELRIRNYALTILAAILGLAAVALKDKVTIELYAHHIHLGAVVLFIGAFVWLNFYLMDKFWYHKLLYGAVFTGMELENLLEPYIKINLSKNIKSESPIRIFGRAIGSRMKINVFYLSIFCLLIVLGIAVQLGK